MVLEPTEAEDRRPDTLDEVVGRFGGVMLTWRPVPGEDLVPRATDGAPL